MPIEPYSGTPPDSYGSDGQVVFDYVNRFYWGPKGSVTPGSWVGTAAGTQGPPGLPLLYSQGVPASSFGNPGNACMDLVTGNTYLQTASGWVFQGQIANANYTPLDIGGFFYSGTPGANGIYNFCGPDNATTYVWRAPRAGQLYGLCITGTIATGATTLAAYIVKPVGAVNSGAVVTSSQTQQNVNASTFFNTGWRYSLPSPQSFAADDTFLVKLISGANVTQTLFATLNVGLVPR